MGTYMKILQKTALTVGLVTLMGYAHAGGLLLNDEDIRRDLNWLATRNIIQTSVTTWPLSEDEIQAALATAQGNTSLLDQAAIDRIKKRIAQQKNHFILKAKVSTDNAVLPQKFDDQEKAQYGLTGIFNARDTNWEIQLQANGEGQQRLETDDNYNLDGTYVAGQLFNQWLIAGAVPTWWGPGHDGSLIRSDAAHAVIGVTAQRNRQTAFNTPWLSWIGPWQYQLFAGQLQDYEAIPHTKLLGMRLNIQPTVYLELGASRTVQWGGEGRPESADSLFKALTGTQDNNDAGQDFPDPANQLGGFEVKLKLMPLLGLPANIYGQAIGEDEAGGLPAKYLQMLGVEGSAIWQDKNPSWYVEYANTKTNLTREGYSYGHGTYKDGYYQHGFPLGHAIGGDGEMVSAGVGMDWDSKNYFGGRAVFAKVNPLNQNINQAFPEKDNLKGIDLNWKYQYNRMLNVKTNIWLVDAKHTDSDAGLGVAIEMPFDLR